jgi:hypothetical protein
MTDEIGLTRFINMPVEGMTFNRDDSWKYVCKMLLIDQHMMLGKWTQITKKRQKFERNIQTNFVHLLL